jgi:nitroreductase/dihydropteridine reductase
MDISRISQTRHTAKAFDPNQQIPAETIEKLRILLRNAPSSVNSQPWHFLIASTPAGRARIAKATQGSFAYNEPKVRNASHVVVLCARKTLDDTHLSAVLGQEQVDGRFATPEAMATQDKSRRFYVGLHQTELKDERHWIERQVYLALGTLLLGAGSLQIDACPMEGFDAPLLDTELGLAERGLTSIVLVALGYRSEDDFNAKLPKSRLPETELFTEF